MDAMNGATLMFCRTQQNNTRIRWTMRSNARRCVWPLSQFDSHDWRYCCMNCRRRVVFVVSFHSFQNWWCPLKVYKIKYHWLNRYLCWEYKIYYRIVHYAKIAGLLLNVAHTVKWLIYCRHICSVGISLYVAKGVKTCGTYCYGGLARRRKFTVYCYRENFTIMWYLPIDYQRI